MNRQRFNPYRRDEETIKAIFALIVGFFLLVGFAFWCWGTFIYRNEIDVKITDRWWTWHVSYSYKYESTCTEYVGAGTPEPTPHPCTKTAIRCSVTDSGREYPPVEPNCPHRLGDYRSQNTITWKIRGRICESTTHKDLTADEATWVALKPESYATVAHNFFEHIVSYQTWP